MKTKTATRTRFVCTAALIAALYVGLTLISNAMGLASGEIQFRISEALCALGLFTPAAIPGVSLGCFLANLLTGCAAPDVIFGSLASLIGMLGAYALRKTPFLALLPYVLANVVIVPFVLSYAYGIETAWWLLALSVGVGETVCAYIGGLALYFALKKRKF
jgi:uncharacterized membrane protein